MNEALGMESQSGREGWAGGLSLLAGSVVMDMEPLRVALHPSFSTRCLKRAGAEPSWAAENSWRKPHLTSPSNFNRVQLWFLLPRTQPQAAPRCCWAPVHTVAWGNVSRTPGYWLLSRHSRMLWDERVLIPAGITTQLTLTTGFLPSLMPLWTAVPTCPTAQTLPRCVPVAQAFPPPD